MKNLIRLALTSLSVAVLISCQQSKEKEEPVVDVEPPTAEKVPFELAAHGNKRTDNYYWMKLSDAQ